MTKRNLASACGPIQVMTVTECQTANTSTASVKR